ncbi:MAG: thermonuclease family protein [Pseudomonadota bacterium]
MPPAFRQNFDPGRRSPRATARPTISGPASLTAVLYRIAALFLVLAPALLLEPRAASSTDGPSLPEAGLTALGTSAVAAVIDGDTLALEDGRELRLVGIQAPKLALGRPDFPTWPLAAEARSALERLVQGQVLALFAGGQQTDRHGRMLAHLKRADGLWIQGAMVQAGLARAYSFPDNRALARELLALEAEARAAGRGIWADPFYRVRGPDELADAIDSFQLVEGRVVSATKPKSRLYLNFGADWKTDFTVAIDAKALRLFAAAGLDPLAFQGRRLRVRGWVKSFNGPLIDVTHPEQIEVLQE